MRARLLLFAVLVACVRVEDDECSGNVCGCGDRDVCDFDCDVDDCTGSCESLSECHGSCLDGCGLACRDASDCDLDCGDACEVVCERVSTCEVDCGDDCEVTCRDLSDCDVTMTSGRVVCERVSACDVACIVGDATEPAIDCGAGVWSCGGC